MTTVARLLLILTFTGISSGQEIQNLPGSDSFTINFKHYSGYFQVSNTHFLHYWFVESQNDPVDDPLIFWFNGGPGCSSLEGLLNEMGPYVVNAGGKTLKLNEYAWNKFASVVYIEAPAGVGYSYSTDGNVTTNDDQTSYENYMAIRQFFVEFPSFIDNDVYIMGESYGGVYVPSLTARIIDNIESFSINLKGMAIGNGYLSETLNVDTSVKFAYAHGLIDEKIWSTIETDCCTNCVETCELTDLKDYCGKFVESILDFIWSGGLNVYDLYQDCDVASNYINARTAAYLHMLPQKIAITIAKSWFKDLILRKLKRINNTSNADVPCLNDSDITSYMNDENVRRALHISIEQGWKICSDDVIAEYRTQYKNMASFIGKIYDADVRILLYYGDTDMACNFMMGQEFSANLGIKRTQSKTPWRFHNQIAGFKTIYDGLTFLTIKGTGHMAPQWKASQMQYVIQQFIHDKDI